MEPVRCGPMKMVASPLLLMSMKQNAEPGCPALSPLHDCSTLSRLLVIYCPAWPLNARVSFLSPFPVCSFSYSVPLSYHDPDLVSVVLNRWSIAGRLLLLASTYNGRGMFPRFVRRTKRDRSVVRCLKALSIRHEPYKNLRFTASTL
jgi:hypothetical protein